MIRQRMTLGALAVPILLAVHAPVALAGGPLLSGYGGPGAGAQAIIGGTLLNGPGGGSGGGSGRNAGGSSSRLCRFLFLGPPLFSFHSLHECKRRCTQRPRRRG